jgi:3-methyladenine DNA glycosylase AlkD
MSIAKSVINDLKKYIDSQKKEVFPRFFKTGKGEYGEGDKFWGITVPNIRTVAKQYYKDISLNDIKELINNEIHEIRLTGYIILTYKYEKGDSKEKENIVNFYLNNLKGVNNWDIVDLSCPKILGEYLLIHPEKRYLLYQLANSNNLWEQRISIVSTYPLIKKRDFTDTLQISSTLLSHKHDLIHKAIGWMLREVGKQDITVLRNYLNENIHILPRTTLRYAIEKMDKEERDKYLNM